MQHHATGITLNNAHVEYENQILFDELNFSLTSGQFTSILGPSGVGKSSLLRLIAGLLDFGTTNSSATLQTTDNLPLTNRFSYLSQQDSLMPWLSVIENVLLGYRLRGEFNSALYTKAQHLLVEVGLGKVLQQRPATLSGGMRQRVALVRTFMEDRPIILMDEPFSSLDTITRLELQNLTVKLLHGRTLLLITHDPLEALRISHQIQVMAGRPATLSEPIIPPGTPPRAVNNPGILKLEGDLLAKLFHAKALQ